MSMPIKKSFFITICCGFLMLLGACSSTPKPQNYYESDEYFNYLYSHLNFTPRQKEIVSTGKELIGTPYVYGGTDPREGLDCSGFTQYVYKQSVGVSLPRRARDQNNVGQIVPRKYMLPGDLVFLNLAGRLSHVGIYIGDGRFFHASTSRKRLMVADLNSSYFSPRFDSAVRVTGY